MGEHVLLDPELRPALVAAGLGSVDALLGLGGEPTVRSVVREVALDVDGTAGRFHLKRYVYPSWRASRGLLGRGTLWGTAPELREFQALTWLRQHGIPAVRPVAAASRTRAGRLVAHLLLTELVADAPDLSQRLRAPDDPVACDAGLRRRVLGLLGGHLARMHAGGFVHGDAYARNVLVRVDEVPRVWFLDCRRGGRPSRRRRPIDDLATLDGDLLDRVPSTDRLRVLEAYAPQGASLARLASRVARARRRHRRREDRKGRVRR